MNDGDLPIERGVYLTDDDILRRHVITKVMCNFEINFESIEKQFGIVFKEYFQSSLSAMKEFAEDDLVKIYDTKLEVTQMGRLLIRNIAMNFDHYIEQKQDNARYSRTV